MIEYFLAIFIPLFIIVNPSSTLALFSALTSRYTKKNRVKTAKSAAVYAAILLIIFAFAGSAILSYLQIQIYSFRIAGGILLAFVGLDMTRRGQQFGESPPGKEHKADFALVPLAMPSLAGPGAITVTIVSMQTITDISWTIRIALTIAAIIITMIITFLIFLSSGFVIKALGKKGMDAFTRVMGLLTVAIAIQFALTGLASWISTIKI
jgi:multiple antibiotic resistance protein